MHAPWHTAPATQGYGTFRSPDGAVYQGGWQANLKHGLGRKTYVNGDFYEGLWRQGKAEGPGRWALGALWGGSSAQLCTSARLLMCAAGGLSAGLAVVLSRDGGQPCAAQNFSERASASRNAEAQYCLVQICVEPGQRVRRGVARGEDARPGHAALAHRCAGRGGRVRGQQCREQAPRSSWRSAVSSHEVR